MTGLAQSKFPVFRFSVGDFSCLALRDNTAEYPIAMFLTNLPRSVYEPWLRERSEDLQQVEVPYTCLFIDTGKERLLIDTGIGRGLTPEPGKLIPLLRAEGIEPQQVDTVVISHAHPDHVGGNLTETGRPAFPNARYVIFRKEWDYWTSNPSLDELPVPSEFKQMMTASALENLRGVESQIGLIEPDTEIVSGITAIAAFGHSPGQMALEISSDRQKLLFVSDAVVLPLHFEFPESIGATDHNPAEVAPTRIRLLEKAAREGAMIGASHLPFPGLGRTVQKGRTCEWQAVA